jgi:hypothetical protein
MTPAEFKNALQEILIRNNVSDKALIEITELLSSIYTAHYTNIILPIIEAQKGLWGSLYNPQTGHLERLLLQILGFSNEQNIVYTGSGELVLSNSEPLIVNYTHPFRNVYFSINGLVFNVSPFFIHKNEYDEVVVPELSYTSAIAHAPSEIQIGEYKLYSTNTDENMILLSANATITIKQVPTALSLGNLSDEEVIDILRTTIRNFRLLTAEQYRDYLQKYLSGLIDAVIISDTKLF